MPTSSSDAFPAVPQLDRNQGRAANVPLARSPLGLCLCLLVLAGAPAEARKQQPDFGPAPLEAARAPAEPGAIFRASDYAPLTSGTRAARAGDVLTIVLAERTSASKASSSGSDRSGSIGLTPPATGPFNLFKPGDIAASGAQGFKGKGESAQSNALSGEISVVVAETFANGTMRVRGEKIVTLSRGEERVQISGIVRAADISPDNRIASTRVADARIRYVGKGHVADASRPGWLQRFFAKVSPF